VQTAGRGRRTDLAPEEEPRPPIANLPPAHDAAPHGGTDMPENVLYYGDNLDILRRYVADESVDLIYSA